MIRRLMPYLKPYIKYIIALMICIVSVSVLALADAMVVGLLTDAIFYRSKGITFSERKAVSDRSYFWLRHQSLSALDEQEIRSYLPEKSRIVFRYTDQGVFITVSNTKGFDAAVFSKKIRQSLAFRKSDIKIFTLTPFEYDIILKEKAVSIPQEKIKEAIAAKIMIEPAQVEINQFNETYAQLLIYFINPIEGLEPLRLGQDIKDALRKIEPGLSLSYTLQEQKVVKTISLFPNVYTVVLLPFFLLLLHLVRGIFTFGQHFLSSYIGQKVVKKLREDVYEHIQFLSLSFYETKMQTGQIISRIVNDINMVQFFLTVGMTEIVAEPAMIVSGILAGFYLNWQLALVAFTLIPLTVIPIIYVGKKMRSLSRQAHDKSAEITSVIEETVTGVRVIKAFNMEAFEVERFKRSSLANFKALMRNARLQGVFIPMVSLFAATALALFIWYGGMSVLAGNLRPSELIAFFFIMGMISNPIKKLSTTYGQVQHSLAAMERIFSILDLKPEVQEAPDAISLPELKGKVVFENVNFGYQGKKGSLVLKDINLEVNPGEIIALVGPSGAGKTSLVNLILRLYDPKSGSVRIDGYDIRDVTFASLRSQIGLVSQDTVLFRATVTENILYGRPGATMDEVIEAAKIANAHDFILNMPQGYDTMIAERGQSLSGGQKQRIAIARAVLRNPKILILDEATSALDAQSEKLVQEALEKLLVARTTFIIAHRLSTIRKANRIVVLNEGRIIEMGSHLELMKKGGLYKSLYETQFQPQKVV